MESRGLLRALLPGLIVLGVHLVLWQATPAYRVWPWLDRVVHAAGGAAAAWAVLCLMRAPQGAAWWGRHRAGGRGEALALLAWLGLVVVCWEFFEWGLDAGGLNPNARTDDETIADMGLGMMGGLGLIALTRRR